MDQFRAQVLMQMNRFLLIQNAAEDASEGSSDSVSRHLLITRLEVFEANWVKFRMEHEKMCLECPERIEDEPYVKQRTYERCQEFYVQAKAVLLEQQEQKEASHSSSRWSEKSPPEVRHGSRRGNLPKIKLPSFSGDYSTWRSFHDLFASMVGDNRDITNVEKMHYLKTCLTGDAARLVTNLKVDENTFSIAWKTLISRYENKRVLISAQLDRLFRLKPMKTKSAQELNTIIATVTESLGALEALDCSTSSWDPLVIYLIARLLDAYTREAWEVELGPSTSFPTWKKFEEFIIGYSRAWESLASASNQPGKEKRFSYSHNKSDTKSRSLVAVASSSKDGSECREITSSVVARVLVAVENAVVNITPLCIGILNLKKNPQKPITLLATCQVRIQTRDGDFVTARALLDPGSELSFILESLVQRLRLVRKAATIPLLGIGGTCSGRTKGSVDIVLHSLLDVNDSYSLQAYILPRLTCEIPSFIVIDTSWTHLNDLPLADINFGKPGPIHIIIGADHYGQIIKPELRKGRSFSPIEQLTLFGWAISGPVSHGIREIQGGSYHCHVDHDLQNLLTNFWKQEDIPKTVEKSLSSDEADRETQFCSNSFLEIRT
ncbi:PREDICTED: uncharacterized protein LOC108771297, partial [Cyphomyrmex costatus]|uniref:uncharacterized protein LOC108771297 n=1 Tax=Cyphomyrmex costatus TaxID=456900 RepID=UPI0008522620